MFLFQALPLPLPHCLTLHSALSEQYDDIGLTRYSPSLMLIGTGGILILTLVFLFLLSLGVGVGGGKRSSLPPPPGPHRWALPIVGDLPYLMVMVRHLPLHQALYKMSKRYGPLMELRLGTSQRILVASSPSAARLILQTHDKIFSYRAPNIVTSIIFSSPPLDITFSDPGPQWKLLRHICINQLVAPKSLLAFRPVIHEEVRSMISSILDAATSSPGDNNENLVIRYRIQKCTNNIISRMAIGKTMDEEIIDLLLQLAQFIGAMNIGDFFPSLAWMDLQGYGRRTKDVFLKCQNLVNKIISERRDEMAKSTTPLKVDLLNILLSIKDKDVEITDNIITSTLVNIFSGGTDTTFGTIEWALAELLANPNKMELLQSELTGVIGNRKCVDISDLPNLPYLSAVVKETMRMHPVVPLLVPHKLTHSCELLGYEILAGTQVYVNVWAIGHDPNVWENPLLFSPERFLDNGLTNVKGVNWNFLPFGSGRRRCPGSALAILNVEFILASLLHNFEWKACGEPKLTESFGLIVHMETPLVVKAYPRLPLQMY